MHRLILLRHAKAAWPGGVADQHRPLADRGEDDASVAAGLFGDVIPVPGLVLCSPALRTRQTWAIAGSGLDPAPPVRYEPAIYGAGVDDIAGLVHGTGEDVGIVLVTGHEPTMSRATLALAGPSSSPEAHARVEQKYPTCGIAVLRLDTEWKDLAPGTAVLESFTVPRA